VSFSKYYQSELTYLREMGRSFSQANPTIAGLLGERGADPDVERMLEGFAFLTGRIRERIDDAVPEIVHALTDLLLPHYLRSIPATSILEFSPQVGALRGRHIVARGTPVGAEPRRGTACVFRTTCETDLLPLAIRNIVMDLATASTPVLKVQFDCADKGLGAVFEKRGVRFFFSGEYPSASMLYLWFMRHLKQIELRGQQGTLTRVLTTLPPSLAKPVGFAPDSSLFPWPPFAPHGLLLLQEYFTLPSKFLFVDIAGLDEAAVVAEENFELWFYFDRPPALPTPVGKQSLRLHCAPVVNLWSASVHPVKKSAIEHDHLLKAGDADPEHMEVYSIDSVVGTAPGRSAPLPYQPFVAFSHAGGEGEPAAFYSISRNASPADNGIDTYFSLITPRGAASGLGEETFSIEGTFTNRFLAGELLAGQINQPVVGSPAVARFRNITEVTKPVKPPLGGELYWRLLSHLALNPSAWDDASKLRAVLELYNFQALANQAAGLANRLRTESIHDLKVTPTRRIIDGAAVQGLAVRIEVQEEKLASEGDVFLLGCILNEIFSDRTSINSFIELTLRLHASQGEYRWLPRAGNRTIV
jgi:type VI secretion system protein ImpG